MGEKTKTTSCRKKRTGVTLSELLRSLYRHGIEFCLLFSPGEGHPVFSKDQIISVLEKGEGERSVSELTELCSSFSTLEDILERNILGKQTELLVVKDTDLRILPVSSLSSLSLEDTGKGVPLWWDAPVPFVSWAKGRFSANRSAAALLGGAAVSRGQGSEFLCELKENKCFLFREIHPSVFLVDDVSQDMVNAKEMAWWAAVGKAFVSRLRCKGISVEKIDDSRESSHDNSDDILACVWDEEILGYLKVKDGSEF
jgi:hypothetical protein